MSKKVLCSSTKKHCGTFTHYSRRYGKNNGTHILRPCAYFLNKKFKFRRFGAMKLGNGELKEACGKSSVYTNKVSKKLSHANRYFNIKKAKVEKPEIQKIQKIKKLFKTTKTFNVIKPYVPPPIIRIPSIIPPVPLMPIVAQNYVANLAAKTVREANINLSIENMYRTLMTKYSKKEEKRKKAKILRDSKPKKKYISKKIQKFIHPAYRESKEEREGRRGLNGKLKPKRKLTKTQMGYLLKKWEDEEERRKISHGKYAVFNAKFNADFDRREKNRLKKLKKKERRKKIERKRIHFRKKLIYKIN
jgi:hypothetical protein